ncbi:hypothetical protein JC794_03950 [Morganella morganii]|uniref:hypothetical protein n=1 Tax=Morganella morganii TaxID=582 RepID=UPI001C48FF01|nr:hypothetical protein [Morganella morganii]QXO58502.1 hypothetical protein JC827_03950 [Morganella morganii]QXO60739.1 hypothetical protein JC826_14820 [Morganella morganii]QXO77466.1 hypothetical protein JC794_03950 [Morganella morganii]
MSVKITILITEKKGGGIRFEAEAAGEQSTGKELRIAEDLKDKLIRLLKDSQPSTKKRNTTCPLIKNSLLSMKSRPVTGVMPNGV